MLCCSVDAAEGAELRRCVNEGSRICSRSDSSTPSESSVPLSQRLATNRGNVSLFRLLPFLLFLFQV
jgi:hypothetical protein